MEIMHSRLAQKISDMEQVTIKGQPFSKRNKTRRIRKILVDMRREMFVPPSFGDVWFIFKTWVAGLL